MNIGMENLEKLTLAEMEEFLANNKQVNCTAVEKDAVYGFIERMLRVQQYRQLSKGEKGVVKKFLSKITGISRAQLTRLTHRWMEHRKIERRPARRPDFPRRYTDNALVEGKNGSVLRKQIGYGPITAEHAEEFQKFYTAKFNPYLNFHRPCGFATIVTNAKGKRKRVYRHDDYRTPYEKLKSIKGWQKCLKEGISKVRLDLQAKQMTDTVAAQRMNKAKLELLSKCRVKT